MWLCKAERESKTAWQMKNLIELKGKKQHTNQRALSTQIALSHSISFSVPHSPNAAAATAAAAAVAMRVCVYVCALVAPVLEKRTMSNTKREKVAAESSSNNNNGNGARIVCSVENFMRDVWYLLVCEMCVFQRDHFFVNSSSDTNVAALTRIFTKRSRTIF